MNNRVRLAKQAYEAQFALVATGAEGLRTSDWVVGHIAVRPGPTMKSFNEHNIRITYKHGGELVISAEGADSMIYEGSGRWYGPCAYFRVIFVKAVSI